MHVEPCVPTTDVCGLRGVPGARHFDAAGGGYPALEALLCSLVLQGVPEGGDAPGGYGQMGG